MRKHTPFLGRAPTLALAAGLAALGSAALAQAAGFASTTLITSPITGDDTREAVLATATLAPGAATPVHSHPGDCIGTVIEGTIELRIPGKEARRYAAGEAYANPRGTVHQLVNVGSTPVRIVNTLLVDKGKPRLEVQPPGAQ